MDHDLIVVGGGPVGVSLARAPHGLSVALLTHAARAQPQAASQGFDARVYALSPPNVAFAGLAENQLTPVYAMRVCADEASCITFDAYEAGVPALAWIVEHRVLEEALWSQLECLHIAPAHCEALTVDGERARLRLRDGRELAAKLIAGADGASSFVRHAAGIAASDRSYGQSAVVANFACSRAHQHTAYQWFQGGPVLALLPLPGNHVSMVWSLPEAEALRVETLDAARLCREVELAAKGVLGELELVTAPRRYPLRRLSARRLVGPRIALAGDAAHVIHPLAGQGLNLGLQDARALADTLAAREPFRDPGDLRLLRRYERARAEPILAMDVMVDGLQRLFGANSRAMARLRNAGLNLTDRLPVLKNVLIRQAMS